MSKELENNIIKEIQSLIGLNYKNIKTKDLGFNFILGLSGGPDSTFLAHMLYNFKKQFSDVCNINILAVHVNHMFRDDAINDEKFSEKLAKDLEFEFKCFKIDAQKEAKNQKKSFETFGREYRYNVFSESANMMSEENGLESFIFTAHIADDNAETVFMNIIRGTNKKGLLGIPKKSKNKLVSKFYILRPLLNIYKKQILEYLNKKNLKYKEDKTNFENDYTRNKIRNQVFNLIDSLGFDVKSNLNALSNKIELEEDYLDNLILNKLNKMDRTQKDLENITRDKNYIKVCDISDSLNNLNNANDLNYSENSENKIFKILDLNYLNSENVYIMKRIIEKVIRDEYTNLNNITSSNIDDILKLAFSNIKGKMISPNKNLVVYIDKSKNENRSKRNGEKVLVFIKKS